MLHLKAIVGTALRIRARWHTARRLAGSRNRLPGRHRKALPAREVRLRACWAPPKPSLHVGIYDRGTRFQGPADLTRDCATKNIPRLLQQGAYRQPWR